MESITWDDITLLFHLNRDRTVNLRKRMTVMYKDAEGNQVVRLMYPVYDHHKGFGTIKNQIDAIKRMKRDDSWDCE